MANTKKTNKKKTTTSSSRNTNNNTGMFVGIALVVVAVIAIVAGVVIAKNNGGGVEGGATTANYSNVDRTIEYGAYDEMATLSKDIQNGYATGQVVKVDGIVSHPISTYSIVEASADGSQKIGTQFIIDGADESAYPADGARVVITGEVVEKSPMYFIIKTTPEYVEVR